MSKRTSGLGRGLGDLLADNSPEIRGGATVVRRGEDGEATVTPDLSDGVESLSDVKIYGEAAENGEKSTEKAENRPEGSKRPAEPLIITSGGVTQGDPLKNPPSGGTETAPHHRSLKALFKSYK